MIKVYGADWCSDCIVLKKVLLEYKIEYKYIDISKDEEAIKYIEKINNGKRTIPTLIINDKSYTNPKINNLLAILRNEKYIT